MGFFRADPCLSTFCRIVGGDNLDEVRGLSAGVRRCDPDEDWAEVDDRMNAA